MRLNALLFALAWGALPARAAEQSKSIPELPAAAVPAVSEQTQSAIPAAPELQAGIPASVQGLDVGVAAPAPTIAAAASAAQQVQQAAVAAGGIQAALSPARADVSQAKAQGDQSFDLARPRDPAAADAAAVPGSYSAPASGLAPYSAPAGNSAEGYAPESGLVDILNDAVDRGALSDTQREQWQATAYRDPLTGLRNRRYLDDHLPALVSGSKSLITLKLDFLKEINDSYDHETGNKFLKALAAVASGVLGGDAALIRRSPTGFAVFTQSPPAQARLVAEALRAAVAQKLGDPGALLPGAGDRAIGGTISLGVAAIPGGAPATEAYARAYESAEEARVEAKDAGGGDRVALAGDAEDGGARLMDRLSATETAERLRGELPGLGARLTRVSAESLEALSAQADARPAPSASDLLAAVKDPRLHQALFETVYLDRLSGLPNRRWLFDNLESIVGPRGFTSYTALDLDRFGAVNELLGEAKADLVLRELGRVLNEEVRGQDAMALHLSGEEFVILSRGGDARELAERARSKVREELGRRSARLGVVDPADGGPLTLTASFGVGAIRRGQGAPDHVLALATAMAEALLQRAKENGRDRVEAPEDLEAKLKRFLRIDETARRAARAALEALKPEAVSQEELFNDGYRPRSAVLAALGYNPASQAGVLLSDAGKGGTEVYRLSAAGRPARVVKYADAEVIANELFGRNVLRGFETFNQSLYSADAVAYGRWPLRPVLVMEDLGRPRREGLVDSDALPLAQMKAFALFALTFGVGDLNPNAFVRMGWGRTAVVDFEHAREPIAPNLNSNRFVIFSEMPWISGSFLNDLVDYHDAIESWKREFARPRTQSELAGMLRRSGVPERRIPADLALFSANLEKLEPTLAADIAAANRDFRGSCQRAGLDEGQTEALSAINKAAHVSIEGGVARDVARFLSLRLSGAAQTRPTLDLSPEEFHRLAVRRQSGLKPEDRRAVLRAAEAGRLGSYLIEDVRRALVQVDRALPPASDF